MSSEENNSSYTTMAIKRRGVSPDGKREMTMEEFKRWMHGFDSDRDGKISREELREAIKESGGWFSGWKSSRMIRSVDSNGNGTIDENEINSLLDFAEKSLGFRIVSAH